MNQLDILNSFTAKINEINAHQEQLYFIAKDYFKSIYPYLNKGNYFAVKHSQNDVFYFCYQPNDFRVIKHKAYWYLDEETNRLEFTGNNRIEMEFQVDLTLKLINKSGFAKNGYVYMCDYALLGKNTSAIRFFLGNDLDIMKCFEKYGIRKSKPNKTNLMLLMSKMIEFNELQKHQI